MATRCGSAARGTQTRAAEADPKVTSQNDRELRRLSFTIETLDKRKGQRLMLLNHELLRIRHELDNVIMRKSTPLDRMTIPKTRLVEIGYRSFLRQQTPAERAHSSLSAPPVEPPPQYATDRPVRVRNDVRHQSMVRAATTVGMIRSTAQLKSASDIEGRPDPHPQFSNEQLTSLMPTGGAHLSFAIRRSRSPSPRGRVRAYRPMTAPPGGHKRRAASRKRAPRPISAPTSRHASGALVNK